MNKDQSAREAILAKVQTALEAYAETPLERLPQPFEPRTAAGPDSEMDLLLDEVRRLSGQSRKVQGPEEFAFALEELVKAEGVRKASFSDHPSIVGTAWPSCWNASGWRSFPRQVTEDGSRNATWG